MDYKIEIGEGKFITLTHDRFDDIINVYDLTKIDTGNVYGEAVTISAALNRIGLLRAAVKERIDETKLELKIFEGNFKGNHRKTAAEEGGYFKMRIDNKDVKVKATERALETCFETDPKWIELKKKFIKAENNFDSLDSLYWSCNNKAAVLKNLVSGTTPEEFIEELIEGKINGILVKK